MRCRHARPSKPIQPGNESELRRSFDVTEQNYRLLVCQVLGSMDVGFIEDKVFAVAASRSYQSCRLPRTDTSQTRTEEIQPSGGMV